MIALFQHLANRGYQWSNVNRSFYTCMVSILCVSSFTLAYHLYALSQLSKWYVILLLKGPNAEVLTTLYAALSICGAVSQVLCFAWFAGYIWLSMIVCSLHRFDLTCYEKAVSRALESVASPSYCSLVLLKIEGHITQRLQHASETWVSVVVRSICVLWACFGLGVAGLISLPRKQPRTVVPNAMIAAVCAITGIVLAYPLASLNVFFDVHVRRSLNNPQILHSAQRIFGQQFLVHVKELDWGFRIGSNTINMNGIAKVALALFITSMATLGQALVSHSRTHLIA